MNHENMRRLADKIEFEDRFDYGQWLHIPGIHPWSDEADSRDDTTASAEHADRLGECGTAGCVAGWAAHLAVQDGMNPQGRTVDGLAKTWLELEYGEAHRLFYAEVMVGAGHETAADAMLDTTAVEIAKVLRQIADGEREL